MNEWQDISTAPKNGAVKWGYADGCQFAMVWRHPAWFKGMAMSYAHETGAWVAQGYGVAAFTGHGLPNIVRPTFWQPLPEPPATS
jgi:hypothetical protein